LTKLPTIKRWELFETQCRIKKKPQDENIMPASAMQGGHNEKGVNLVAGNIYGAKFAHI